MKYGRGYVYYLYYHIVWCVKYRHKILKGSIKEDLINIIIELCKNNNYELKEININLEKIKQKEIKKTIKQTKNKNLRLLLKNF